MLVKNESEQFKTIVRRHICEHHKKHPNDLSYAGCTCCWAYTSQRKTSQVTQDRRIER